MISFIVMYYNIFQNNLYDILLFTLVFPLLIIKLLLSIIFDLFNNNNNNFIINNYNNSINSIFTTNELNSYKISNMLFTSGFIILIASIIIIIINNNNNNNNNSNNSNKNDNNDDYNNLSLQNIENINDTSSNKSINSPYYIASKTNDNDTDDNNNNDNNDDISIDSETLTLLEETNIKMKKLALTNKNILIGWYIKVHENPSYSGEIIGLKRRVLRSTLFIIKLDDNTLKEVSLKRIDGDKVKGEIDFTLIEKMIKN